GAAFVPASASVAPPRPLGTVPGSMNQRRTAEPIIDHNPFDSQNPSLHPKPEEVAAAEPTAPEITDPLAAPGCDGVQAFIITESTDPTWSVAALQGSGEPRPRMRRVGDEIAGKQIAYIGFNPREGSPSVWLSQGSSLCQVMLFKSTAVAQAPAAPTTT